MRRRALVLSLLAILTWPWPPRAAAQAPPTLPPAYFFQPTAAYRYGQSRTDGTSVVWVRGDEISLASLRDRVARPVARGDYPDVDNGIVVWAEGYAACDGPAARGQFPCYSVIRGQELATGRAFVVADSDETKSGPTLLDGRVYWVSWTANGPGRLWARDLRPLAEPVVLATGLSPWFRWRPEPLVGGTQFVWAEATRLLALRLGDGPREVAALGRAITIPEYGGGGDLLVYTGDDRQPVIVNLRTNERRRLDLPGPPPIYPATDGRYVFWSGLVGYDTVTGQSFRVPLDAPGGTDLGLHPRGGALVWNRGQDVKRGLTMLLAAPLEAALAPVARPAPSSPLPGQPYFADTHHYLGPAFASFWEGSGGLPVFGYPLTEAFQEPAVDPATGRPVAWWMAQYFERQRFEHHSEYQGTPYEVLLGHLGAEEVAQRADLRGLWAFNPVSADAQHPAGCRYVPETRHRLCGEFRPYWERHGLELGDPGVSFRESLALFGYPISEELIDPATGLVTQYFERARFEWHPNNPEPYRVLLGRLAADRLAGWGWAAP